MKQIAQGNDSEAGIRQGPSVTPRAVGKSAYNRRTPKTSQRALNEEAKKDNTKQIGSLL
ncbi:MAG: hypothetical protein IJU76_12750 [Desulfovibrionaceae bacterium]|nr:hypothetical protein [Desulfovibrionaceae bacterium]